MSRWMEFFPDGKGTEMRFLRFGEPAFVRIKNREIIQDRRDIGMLRAELFFVNLERLQVVGLGRLLPAGFSINQRDVVENRPEVRIGNVRKACAGLECRLVIAESGFGFPEIVANETQPPR